MIANFKQRADYPLLSTGMNTETTVSLFAGSVFETEDARISTDIVILVIQRIT